MSELAPHPAADEHGEKWREIVVPALHHMLLCGWTVTLIERNDYGGYAVQATCGPYLLELLATSGLANNDAVLARPELDTFIRLAGVEELHTVAAYRVGQLDKVWAERSSEHRKGLEGTPVGEKEWVT